jgi:pyruvate dehydrogenase E2 component (dihydrolipoamide acetyltransferase)
VGYGRIVTRPWVVEGQVVPRRVVTATLAADHRACDGHLGSRFLSRIDQLLRSPDRLDEPQ